MSVSWMDRGERTFPPRRGSAPKPGPSRPDPSLAESSRLRNWPRPIDEREPRFTAEHAAYLVRAFFIACAGGFVGWDLAYRDWGDIPVGVAIGGFVLWVLRPRSGR